MKNRRIILSHRDHSTISGIPNASWTTVPGTDVYLTEGKYLVNAFVRIGGARSAFNGDTNTLFLRDSLYNTANSQSFNISNSQVVEVTIPWQIVYDVVTPFQFYLEIYINLNGTVTSRSIFKSFCLIERIN